MERAEARHEQETEALILTEERLRKADDAEKGRALLQNLLAAQHHLEVLDKDTADMLRAGEQHLEAYTLTDDEDVEGLIAACREVERRVLAGGRQDAQHAQCSAP